MNAARLGEPFIKGHICLWLRERGAQSIHASVDGAESEPEAIQRVLVQAGLVREPRGLSQVGWTGLYRGSSGCIVYVESIPGADIDATMAKGQHWIVECKGEPTPAGAKAGRVRTSFYTAIGELLMAAGGKQPLPDRLFLGFPDTDRIGTLGRGLVENPLVRQLGISVLLVNGTGAVREVSPDGLHR